MPEKLGIENLKSVVKAVLKLGEAGAAVADGLDLGDLGEGVQLALALAPAIKAVRSGQIIPEFKDLDEVERVELTAFIDEEFASENDALEATVENVLHVIVKLSDIVKAVG